MLIDDYLPSYHASEHHQLVVEAPARDVYAALRTADLGGHPVIKTLMALRGLPALLAAPREGMTRFGQLRARSRVTLGDILGLGFVLLAEEPGRELLLGVVGRFWRPTGNVEACDAARFRQPLAPGTARGAWNFAVTARGDGASLLTTETRVECADAAALRSFRRYWLVVRPFSGLIRRLMLRSVARASTIGLPEMRGYFVSHSEATLEAWAKRLHMFRFFRAYGGQNNDGDALVVVFRYNSIEQLREFFGFLGVHLMTHTTEPPRPELGKSYPADVFAEFPFLIPGSCWIEQPGHCKVAGHNVFVWCELQQIKLSIASGYRVTEADVESAEVVEQALIGVQLQRVEPPIDNRNCICPKYYPEYFGPISKVPPTSRAG